MGKMNKFLILIVSVAVLATLAGTASASVTFHVDQIQTNGVYKGIPKLISGETSQYGYEYTLIPDGTFTVIGHVDNDGSSPVRVGVDFGTAPNTNGMTGTAAYKDFNVPAAVNGKPGTESFSLTWHGDSAKQLKVWVTNWTGGSEFVPYDLSNVDYVDAPQSQHTIDEGPMSNTVAVFANGNMSYSGLPQYSVSLY